MCKKRIALLALALLGMTELGWAANFTVDAGGNGLVFTPPSLTINVGDTVTFQNAGGFHNVTSDTGLFRCANGCDATGGDGSPSSASWSATVAFNSAGTFGYHCEVHGSFGMTGSITVNAASSPPTAVAQSVNVSHNTPATIVLGATDANSGGPFTFTFAIATAPLHGTVTLAAATAIYTPSNGYSGADSFTFTASDVNGVSPPATVDLVVAGAPAAPPTMAPTLAWYGALGLILLLLAAGVWIGRRRLAARHRAD
jgi:plastocyanin